MLRKDWLESSKITLLTHKTSLNGKYKKVWKISNRNKKMNWITLWKVLWNNWMIVYPKIQKEQNQSK